MRRRNLFALLLCFLILSGCTAGDEPAQQALDFRTGLMEAGGCSFTAAVRADFGDRIYSFTLACQYSEEEAQLEVLEPENIAGVKAAVSDDGAQIEFEDIALDFGQLANGHVSAVAAPWLLARCWEGAYIAWSGPDGGQERVTYLRGYNDEEVTVDTWFLDGVPTYAEVTCDGTRCLTAEITEFKFLS